MESPKFDRKRSSTSDETNQQDVHPSKRQRTTTQAPVNETVTANAFDAINHTTAAEKLKKASEANFAHDGLQRSIVLALQHVGFDSASPEALESLTTATETCE
jgi:transcription initiation factor TFIID subunit 8